MCVPNCIIYFCFHTCIANPSDALAIESCKDIIIAADKYGIVSLKIKMEATLAHYLVLTCRTVAKWILFADCSARGSLVI